MDIGNIHTGSNHLDAANLAIIVPSREEVLLKDPEIYLQRLEELQTPSERLLELLVSIFDTGSPPTHESVLLRGLIACGVFSGWIYGGVLRNLDMTSEYVRKFNAATFDGQTLARKHYTDHYIYTAVGRGVKHAAIGGILCGSAGVVSLGSVVYRNKLYYPDWALGFAAVGSLSRFWSLGTRGAIGGAGFGLIGGTLMFGMAKAVEIMSGRSVSEMRYFQQTEYISQRNDLRERLIRLREKEGNKVLDKY